MADRLDVDDATVRALVERDAFADVLSVIDYQLYDVGHEPVRVEVAQKSRAYLSLADAGAASVDDLERLTLYVPEPLPAVAESAAGTFFETIYEHDPDGEYDTYPVGEGDEQVVFRFDRTHGEAVSAKTRYTNLDVAVPPLDTYEAYSEAVFDEELGE